MNALFTRLLALAAQANDFSTSTAGHSAGQASLLDYLISGAGAIIVLLVIVFAIKYVIAPGERGSDHIKRRILRDGK